MRAGGWVRLALLSCCLCWGAAGGAAEAPQQAEPAAGPEAPEAPDAPPVMAGDLRSVTDYFAARGVSFTQTIASSGNPLLTAKGGGFKISFFCGLGEQMCQGRSFDTLILWHCDAAFPNRTSEIANRVNSGMVFARTYIDAEGKACIEQEVATGSGGISREVMDLYFAGFDQLLSHAGDYFGPAAPAQGAEPPAQGAVTPSPVVTPQ